MKAGKAKSSLTRSTIFMDTVVNIKIVFAESTQIPIPNSAKSHHSAIEASLASAFSAFRVVEDTCSRFDPRSELSQLSSHIGKEVPVSTLLFEALRLALEVAEATRGAFAPTLGSTLVQYGFKQNYRTDECLTLSSGAANYKDVVLNAKQQTVLLERPLLLDLGALAKGLAIDLASKALMPLQATGFYIEAGGDLFASGLNEYEQPWRIGIQHPLEAAEYLATLQVNDVSICTSGSYERKSPIQVGIHHLIDPHSGESPSDCYSCSVVAPFAMLADAYSTAAFILGPEKGREALQGAGLEGLFISRTLELIVTDDLRRYLI